MPQFFGVKVRDCLISRMEAVYPTTLSTFLKGNQVFFLS
jgi:hypothetical protein